MEQLLATAGLVLQFITGLTIVLVVHELGHFFVTRAFGVEVEEFGLGLPPRIANIRSILGTPISLNWLPLGAFVRPKGEDKDSGGMQDLHPLKRICIYLAGPLINLAFAIVLVAILALHNGVPSASRLKVSEVIPGGAAEEAGLRAGDEIRALGGQSFETYEAFVGLVSAAASKPTTLEVNRNGGKLILSVTPRRPQKQGEASLGVGFKLEYQKQGLVASGAYALKKTGDYSRLLLGTLGRMISGRAGVNERLVGFKGMFDVFARSQSTTTGVDSPIWPIIDFFAIISISLGVMNLTPIPALDGGRIFLTLPELLLRTRIPSKIERALILVTTLALIGLMLWINLVTS